MAEVRGSSLCGTALISWLMLKATTWDVMDRPIPTPAATRNTTAAIPAGIPMPVAPPMNDLDQPFSSSTGGGVVTGGGGRFWSACAVTVVEEGGGVGVGMGRNSSVGNSGATAGWGA